MIIHEIFLQMKELDRMRAQVLTGIRQMEPREVPDPAITHDTEVLLKIDRVGVCGSDVHYYETGRIGSQIVQYPFRVGHECAATVIKIGRAVRNVKIGDPIIVEPAVSCHSCDQCKAGRENTCRKLKFLGCPGQIEGCLCDYIVMPQECCFPTYGKLSSDQAVLCEPFAIGIYAVQQSHLPARAAVGILGAGPIGLSCMEAARIGQARAIYVTDKINSRVQIASSAGAVWAGNPDLQDIVRDILCREPLGLDVIYECAGQQSAIDQALELLRPGGTLMLVGIPREDRISFSIDKMRRKELTVINVRRQNHCPQTAIDWIASGKANIDFMVTHHLPFEQTKQAFDLVAGYQDGVIKAIVTL
jgi:L-iditol 2-dehydrogenase